MGATSELARQSAGMRPLIPQSMREASAAKRRSGSLEERLLTFYRGVAKRAAPPAAFTALRLSSRRPAHGWSRKPAA